MIALLLLLAAQAVPAASPASPASQSCVRAAGSEIKVCGTPPAQSDAAPPPQSAETPLPQGTYRLMNLRPRTYGPAPGAQADLGHGIKLRGRTSNSGPARRNRSTATLSVPF